MPIYRSDMHRVHVSVAGVALDNNSWDKFAGGDITPENQKYGPGSSAPEVSIGGRRTRSDITIDRAWDDFLISAFLALDSVAGFAPVTCSIVVLAGDRRTAIGNPFTYTGVLGAVTRPGYDSMSSTAALLQIVITPNEIMTR